jgi:hypothetical protein
MVVLTHSKEPGIGNDIQSAGREHADKAPGSQNFDFCHARGR